jgi:hypothetical protein
MHISVWVWMTAYKFKSSPSEASRMRRLRVSCKFTAPPLGEKGDVTRWMENTTTMWRRTARRNVEENVGGVLRK